MPLYFPQLLRSPFFDSFTRFKKFCFIPHLETVSVLAFKTSDGIWSGLADFPEFSLFKEFSISSLVGGSKSTVRSASQFQL